MKSILVTGGLGFIGSAFVRKLASDNEFKRIIVLDALTYAGDLKTLSALKEDPRIEVVIGNICDRDVVAAAITDIDTVINFAAESHVDNSIDSIKPFIDSNVSGVANLLDIARAKKVSKFLQISTDEVYGSIINGAFDEDSILDPKNPYSATKAAAEHLCSAYANTYKMDISITRSCNNFG
jgi:dTDP-glucose 4,6-dehydratase